jgi:hypothetical protein
LFDFSDFQFPTTSFKCTPVLRAIESPNSLDVSSIKYSYDLSYIKTAFSEYRSASSKVSLQALCRQRMLP